MANRALLSVRTAPEVTLCPFQDPKVPFNDFKGGAKGKTHIRDHNQKLKKGMLTYESV